MYQWSSGTIWISLWSLCTIWISLTILGTRELLEAGPPQKSRYGTKCSLRFWASSFCYHKSPTIAAVAVHVSRRERRSPDRGRPSVANPRSRDRCRDWPRGRYSSRVIPDMAWSAGRWNSRKWRYITDRANQFPWSLFGNSVLKISIFTPRELEIPFSYKNDTKLNFPADIRRDHVNRS